MGGNGVAIEEARKRPANNDFIVEGLGEKRQYPMRERQPLGEWWKYHNLSQQSEEQANVGTLEALLKLFWIGVKQLGINYENLWGGGVIWNFCVA